MVKKLSVRKICVFCNKRQGRRRGKYGDGTPMWGKDCWKCHSIKYPSSDRYLEKKEKRFLDFIKRSNNKRLNRNPVCQNCGFIAKNLCQIDIDHIDGNKKNNNLTNLMILCANCHRLKTFNNRDYLNKY